MVEAVELGPNNELEDPDLIECVRESLLSLTFAPPPEDGRESQAGQGATGQRATG